MATVYIHIGAPKTATSAIQNVLAANYKKLLKQGILYPKDHRHGDAHHTLVCDLIQKHQNVSMPDAWYGDLPRGEAWACLKAEISRHGSHIHSVILSSELLFGQSKNIDLMLEDIASHLDGHRIKVVAYLRRQDELYSSFYNQDVKGIRQWSFSAYEFYEVHQIFQNDYYSLLSTWGNTFGKSNIHVRPYEPEQWLNGDIVQDFCAITNSIPLKLTRAGSNESLGINQLYFKRCLNRIGFDKNHNEDVLRLIFSSYPEQPAKSCLYVQKKLYQKLRREWLETNRKLEQDFLHGDTFFRQPIPPAEKLQMYSVDRMALAHFLQKVIKKLRGHYFGSHHTLFVKALILMLAEQDLWAALNEKDRSALMEWVC